MTIAVNPAFNPGDAAVSISPADGKEIARYQYQSEVEVEIALTKAQAGYRHWSARSVPDRAACMGKLAALLRRDIQKLGGMSANEMGKPIAQARAEVEKCAVMCEWYAENSEEIVRDQATTIGPDAYVSYLPIGQILAVMPWNFPFWQVLRGAVPVLVGGNAYVLKHAPNVMGCAYMLETLLEEAGVSSGAFTVLNITPDLVSKVIADPRIAAVTVTGSARAGSAIAAQAGAALKKTVLELGGSDPFIVLSDADLEEAVKAAVVGRFQNTGQICIAAKRIIVEKPIAAAFTERFVAAVKALKMGSPLDESVYLGPMARFDLRDELDRQVRATVEEGAHVALGGHKADGNGNYFEPTVLTDVKPGMTSFTQEIFGPVASIIVADDAEQAVQLANDSEFGLSAALWTQDTARAKAIARRLEAGGAFINGFSASDPRVPIGGVKKSGYGRELSHFGIFEFMNAQTVWFDRK